jgi:hypothetical protein
MSNNSAPATELFQLVLEHRTAILSVERWSYEEQKETPQPLFQFDHTDPIIKDSRIVPSSCDLEPTRDQFLAIEWSQQRQELFEECVGMDVLESERLRNIIQVYGTHWKNAASAYPVYSEHKSLYAVGFLEPYAPGVTLRLHELGKTKGFNSIDAVEGSATLTFNISINENGEVETSMPAQPPSISERGFPVYEGDELLTKFAKRVRSEYRANYIAERGMTEYVGRMGLVTHFDKMTCPLCKETFWPQAVHGSDIARTGVPRYCADCHSLRSDVWRKIPLDEDTRRELAIRGIELASELTGLFPFKNLKRQTIGHLEPEVRDNWFLAQVFMPGASAKTLFGSWDEMLTHTSAIGARPRKGRGGYVSTSACGHVCYSIGERLVCDRLHELNIAHDKEPKYPKHPELNPNGLLRGDWLVNGYLMELAGYPDDSKYMKRMGQKQELAVLAGLDFVVLMPSDLKQIDAVLSDIGIIDVGTVE